MKLEIVPVTLRESRRFVSDHHRHHKAPPGGLFAIGCRVVGAGALCGVAIIGRPVARMIQDGRTAEVTRCCTDGTPNACSALYGAAWRAARAMGYLRLVTYTLKSESGGSLIASGWRRIGEAGGGAWSRPSRPRTDEQPQELKIRWEAA